jgi:MYXO-CTERM domain-containing protein
VPIGLITFGLVGSFTEGEAALGFDNMSFGVTGEPLPAPAAGVLGLAGFATLVAARRRRRTG